jgi:hypothetical protein
MGSPSQMTLAQLRLASQQRADMVNSSFISDAEWTTLVNGSLYELYDLLVSKFQDYFIAAPFQITADGINTQYALPNDFYKLAGVDASYSANQPNNWLTLKPFNFQERNRYPAGVPVSSWNGVNDIRYRVVGNNVWFSPMPQKGQLFQIWYIPTLSPLVNDSDVAQGVDGFLELVIVDAAIKALTKEESDVSVLMAEKTALIQRIQVAAANRDAGMPKTVTDVYGGSFGGYGWF